MVFVTSCAMHFILISAVSPEVLGERSLFIYVLEKLVFCHQLPVICCWIGSLVFNFHG